MDQSNLDGQVIGRKGSETRRRLMNAAAEMLACTPLRDLRAADMARKAGISAATFYLYFENVDAVVLALSDTLKERAAGLLALAEQSWTEPNGLEVAAFVRAYFDFWDEHRPILRVRNLAAEEGDARFAASRLSISAPLHQAVAAKIEESRAEHPGVLREDLHNLTLAATILAAMERNAASYRMFPARFGVSRERLIASTIFMIRTMLGGLQGH